jgi:hypothetical protein
MKFSASLILGLLPVLAMAQAPALLQGTVVDARTQAPLPYVSIALRHSAIGTVSNAEGVFSLPVPAGHAADSVELRYLGYAPQALRLVPALLAAPQKLALVPQPYTLQEVRVTALSPTTLLKKAVRTTTARMMSPVVLNTYYREFASLNGEYTRFADALVDYYIQGNPRRPKNPEVQARVRESRAGEGAAGGTLNGVEIPSPIDVTKAGNYYDVTERNGFLDSTAFKYYDYALRETAGGAEEAFYLLSCTPRGHDDVQHLARATVRIDRQTLCIQAIESEVAPEMQPYMKSVNLLVVKAKGTSLRKHIEYRELNGRLYPSFVRLQAGVEVTQGSNPPMRYEFASDMLVQNLAASAAPFAKAERHDGSLYKRGTHYTQPYWKAGSTVAATAAEEMVIKQLDAARQ